MARVPSLFNLIYSLLRKKNWRSENLFWYRYLRSVERSVSFQWFVSNLKQLNYTKSKHGHGLTRCRASNAHKRGIPIQLANETMLFQCQFYANFLKPRLHNLNQWVILQFSSERESSSEKKREILSSSNASKNHSWVWSRNYSVLKSLQQSWVPAFSQYWALFVWILSSTVKPMTIMRSDEPRRRVIFLIP